MEFITPNCPECGSKAIGTAEKVVALFEEGDDISVEEFEYRGDTDMDCQTTITNAIGESLLVCDCGNEWFSAEVSDGQPEPVKTTIEFAPDLFLSVTACHDGGGGVSSNLHDESDEWAGDEDEERSHYEFEGAVDMLESLVLAHALAGVDVSSPAYVDGLKTAYESACNNL
ncbi:hypothetical protein FY034_17450 (plasmid) [Trichlorobacter lovleyi]|uniref:hypothetical protein n=1 Tax=Trichlorobacter lovleyi TaxID=313985 RepID=UPI00223E994C|nr:hypothetical protein [Trichlorobacter lovleyi]QOX80809.1 hypothetical protein FY034_17450 [Trichlorobacter lovleyi]